MQICKGTPRLLHRPGVQTRLLACRHPSQQPVAPLRPAWRTYGSCSTLFGPQYGFPAPVRPVCTQSKLSATSLDVGSPPQGEPSPSQSIWKSFWTFTGIFAMLGSVGGALAALLGYWSSSYALALPLLLPILSLIASLQREGLISEVARQQYDSLSNSLRRDSVALLAEVRSNVQEVKAALKVQSSSASRLSSVEARLSSLEGSLLSTGRSLREASGALAALPDRLSASQRTQMDTMLAAMRQDLKRVADQITNEEHAGLAAVNSRLAAIDGSLAGVEVSQGELARRLSLSLNSALQDTEGALQAAVRSEIDRSMDPVRRLPTIIAAALPSMLSAAAAATAVPPQAAATPPAPAHAAASPPQYDGSGFDGAAPAGHTATAEGGAAGAQWSPAAIESLRGLMQSEVQMALQAALEYQRQTITESAAPATPSQLPSTLRLEPEQWDALGKRLTRLEGRVDEVPQVTADVILARAPAQLEPALQQAMRTAADAAAATATSELMSESERLSAMLQSGFAAVQHDVASLAASLGSLSRVDGDGGSGDNESSHTGGVSTMEPLQHQLTVVVQGLGAVEERLTGLEMVVKQSLHNAAGDTHTGSTNGSGMVTAADVAGATGLQQLSESVSSLQAVVQSLSHSATHVQALLESSEAAERAAEEAAARQQALLADQQALLQQQQAQLHALQTAAAAGAAAATAATAAAQPAAAGFPEGLLSREDSPEPNTHNTTTPTEAASIPQRADFPEGLLSREESPAPASPPATNDPAPTTAPPGHSFPEGMLSREDDAAANMSDSETAGRNAQRGNTGTITASGATASTGPAPPPMRRGGGFSEGLLSREDNDTYTYSTPTSPETQAGPGSVTSANGNRFAEGLLSREDDASASYGTMAGGGGNGGRDGGRSGGRGTIPEGMLSREDGTDADAVRYAPPRAAASPEPAAPRARPPPTQAGFPEGLLSREDEPQTPAEAYTQSGAPQQWEGQPGEQMAGGMAGGSGFVARDVRGLSEQEVVAEGLRLLRAGREETQKAEDWGLADQMLREAYRAFQYALELNPNDTRALGNCGNVLLAQGELKQCYLAAVMSGPAPINEREAASQSTAEAALRSEALQLLTRAGEMFKSVLEVDVWSSRALVNWGRAMCLRAELSWGQREVVQKLYRAALDKFEAVLEEEPDMIAARYRAALAMLELAKTYPPGSRDATTLLLDCKNYLTDLITDAASQPEAAALQPSCNAALQQCQEELARAKSTRP